ncbi:hypothetical protein O181_043197 [Austropuccinia psidii MF-1]|uniref:Uncharacterized protein n=1 Tax=Austropuccinia psidii MF-1 TaxID=1389203 RepID=A0A9Q3DK30_9BASI|nr:hypothetical protein [Austropuccinia psidii MF-1]
MVRQENIEEGSTATRIIPASTVHSDHNSTLIITSNDKEDPISSKLINLDISNTLQKEINLTNTPKKVIDVIMAEGQGSVNECQTDKLCHYEADNTILPSKRAENATTSLSGHIKSQPEGIQKCTSTQRVSNSSTALEKLDELLPDCEKVSEPYQYFHITEWVASNDGKEAQGAFDSRMEE